MTNFQAFVPTISEDAPIANQILAHVGGMKRDGSFAEGASLCWSPEQLETLAMFAISAKELLRRAGVLFAAMPTPKGKARDAYTAEGIAILDEIRRLGIPTVRRKHSKRGDSE